MFRAAKNILFIIVLGISLLLLSLVIKDYDENSIPNNPVTVVINSWNHQYTKAEIFNEMTRLAGKGNYQLSMVKTTNLNGKISKTAYCFNPDKKQILSLYRVNSAHYLTQSQLQFQEVKGAYCTNASKSNLNHLQATLQKMGLSAEVYTLSLPKILLNFDTLPSYLTILLSILSILLIIMFMEKIAHFKKYAILQLNGWSFKQILIKDIKEAWLAFIISIVLIFIFYEISIFWQMNSIGIWFSSKYAFLLSITAIFLFISLDLFSYLALALINIYQAVQGQTYTKAFIIIGYLLKVVLITIVITNVALLKNDFNHYKQNRAIMQMWINHRSGYILQFAHVDDKDDKEVNQLGQATRKLIKHSSNVIISKNNQSFQPSIHDINPSNGNVLIVNKNYLKYNKIHYTSNKWIESTKLPSNAISIFIPSTRTYQTNKFLQKLHSFIKFQSTLPSLYPQCKAPKINIHTYRGNQKVFNYTIGNEISNSISLDPIIVVINSKMLSNDFYWATSTQGLVQFQNLKQLQSNIKKVGLTNHIAGITDAKTRLSDFNLKQMRRLLLMTLTVVLSFAQLLVVINFISLAFLQKQRRKLAILKIFGQSPLKVTGWFLILNIFGDLFLFNCFIAVNHLKLNLLTYLLPYLIIEIVVIVFLTKHAEKGLLTTLNRGN